MVDSFTISLYFSRSTYTFATWDSAAPKERITRKVAWVSLVFSNYSYIIIKSICYHAKEYYGSMMLSVKLRVNKVKWNCVEGWGVYLSCWTSRSKRGRNVWVRQNWIESQLKIVGVTTIGGSVSLTENTTVKLWKQITSLAWQWGLFTTIIWCPYTHTHTHIIDNNLNCIMVIYCKCPSPLVSLSENAIFSWTFFHVIGKDQLWL